MAMGGWGEPGRPRWKGGADGCGAEVGCRGKGDRGNGGIAWQGADGTAEVDRGGGERCGRGSGLGEGRGGRGDCGIALEEGGLKTNGVSSFIPSSHMGSCAHCVLPNRAPSPQAGKRLGRRMGLATSTGWAWRCCAVPAQMILEVPARSASNIGDPRASCHVQPHQCPVHALAHAGGGARTRSQLGGSARLGVAGAAGVRRGRRGAPELRGRHGRRPLKRGAHAQGTSGGGLRWGRIGMWGPGEGAGAGGGRSRGGRAEGELNTRAGEGGDGFRRQARAGGGRRRRPAEVGGSPRGSAEVVEADADGGPQRSAEACGGRRQAGGPAGGRQEAGGRPAEVRAGRWRSWRRPMKVGRGRSSGARAASHPMTLVPPPPHRIIAPLPAIWPNEPSQLLASARRRPQTDAPAPAGLRKALSVKGSATILRANTRQRPNAETAMARRAGSRMAPT